MRRNRAEGKQDPPDEVVREPASSGTPAASSGPKIRPAACMVKTSETIMPRVFLLAYSLIRWS